jgi:glyoxylase I family protein
MEANSPLEEHLQELEGLLHSPSVREGAERLAGLLAHEHRESGVSGTVWTRQSVVAALQNEAFSEHSISDFGLTLLASDVARVTCRAHRHANEHRPAAASLRSSIWKRTGARWKIVFHRGTAL